MPAPGHLAAPTQKQAPQAPQAKRIEADDQHPPFRDQHPLGLAQHLVWVDRKIQGVRQHHQVDGIGLQRQLLAGSQQAHALAAGQIQQTTLAHRAVSQRLEAVTEVLHLHQMVTEHAFAQTVNQFTFCLQQALTTRGAKPGTQRLGQLPGLLFADRGAGHLAGLTCEVLVKCRAMNGTSRYGILTNSDQARAAGQRLVSLPLKASSLLLCLGLLGGCMSLPEDKPQPVLAQADSAAQLPCGRPEALHTNLAPGTAEAAADDPAEARDLWQRLRENFRLWHISNARIDAEIKRLQRSPTAFNALIARAEPYLYHIVDTVERRGLPAELALLPAVESGFRPYAYSPNGAAGLWQFMPATGEMLGLEQDWWYDGRRDVLSATDAALEYLERLNTRFDGDWLHALAAYNAGGGTVSRAIRRARNKSKPTDFWNLDLPRETDHYVPRLLALAEVIGDPGRYGLAIPSIEDKPYFAEVPSGGQIDLQIAADLAGMQVEDVLTLNPGHNRWSTHPQGPHRLLLPIEQAEAFKTALDALPEDKRLRWQHHTIASGDNLGKISRQYGVSVKAIMQANSLANHKIRAGKSLLIPLSESVTTASTSRSLGIPRARIRYRVRSGDSLYKIARKFQVKIADLRRWNSVGRYIKPGQHLTVFVDPTRHTL